MSFGRSGFNEKAVKQLRRSLCAPLVNRFLSDLRGSEEVRGSGGVSPRVGRERAGVQDSPGAWPGPTARDAEPQLSSLRCFTSRGMQVSRFS